MATPEVHAAHTSYSTLPLGCALDMVDPTSVGLVVDVFVRDVKWLGFQRLIFKWDNEPAILSAAR